MTESSNCAVPVAFQNTLDIRTLESLVDPSTTHSQKTTFKSSIASLVECAAQNQRSLTSSRAAASGTLELRRRGADHCDEDPADDDCDRDDDSAPRSRAAYEQSLSSKGRPPSRSITRRTPLTSAARQRDQKHTHTHTRSLGERDSTK